MVLTVDLIRTKLLKAFAYKAVGFGFDQETFRYILIILLVEVFGFWHRYDE